MIELWIWVDELENRVWQMRRYLVREVDGMGVYKTDRMDLEALAYQAAFVRE